MPWSLPWAHPLRRVVVFPEDLEQRVVGQFSRDRRPRARPRCDRSCRCRLRGTSDSASNPRRSRRRWSARPRPPRIFARRPRNSPSRTSRSAFPRTRRRAACPSTKCLGWSRQSRGRIGHFEFLAETPSGNRTHRESTNRLWRRFIATTLAFARPRPRLAGMETCPKKTMLIGAILAAVVTVLPFPRFVFGYMGTLLHEFGHTVAAWASGTPRSPPSTSSTAAESRRSTTASGRLMAALVRGVGLVALALPRAPSGVAAAGDPRGTVPGAGRHTRPRDRDHVHGSRDGIDDRRGVPVPRAERLGGQASRSNGHLYAFLGLFLVFGEMRFAWGLANSQEKQIEYGIELSGIPNDWLRIADRLSMDLSTATGLYLLLTPLPVVLALVVLPLPRADSRCAQLEASARSRNYSGIPFDGNTAGWSNSATLALNSGQVGVEDCLQLGEVAVQFGTQLVETFDRGIGRPGLRTFHR